MMEMPQCVDWLERLETGGCEEYAIGGLREVWCACERGGNAGGVAVSGG